jgi:hypothetical protein
VKTRLPNRIDPFVNGAANARPKPSANGHANGKPAAPQPSAAPPADPAGPPPAAADRGPGGRFQPGCRPGPGNPFAKRVASLRKALLDSVTEADVATIGQKLLQLARIGDVPAAKVLLSYLVGKPTAPVDPDRVELEAWKLLLSWPTVAEALAAATAVRPAAAAELVASGAPATADEVIRRGASPEALQGVLRVIRRREDKGR